MITHEQMKQVALSNPKVKAEYDALEDEFSLMTEMFRARKEAGLSQDEVAKRMGTKQSAIARLEASAGHSPSISTLQKYAEAIGCKLDIRLIPKHG